MIATALVAAVLMTGTGTAYNSCDGSTSMTASGSPARIGYVANNTLPLGTWIEMVKPRIVMNRRWFKVMDRGGGSFALDFWATCSWMNSWGIKTVTFKAVPKSDLYRGLPMGGWKVRSGNSGASLSWSPR